MDIVVVTKTYGKIKAGTKMYRVGRVYVHESHPEHTIDIACAVHSDSYEFAKN